MLPLKIIAGCVFVKQLHLSSSAASPVNLAGKQASGDLGKATLNVNQLFHNICRSANSHTLSSSYWLSWRQTDLNILLVGPSLSQGQLGKNTPHPTPHSTQTRLITHKLHGERVVCEIASVLCF